MLWTYSLAASWHLEDLQPYHKHPRRTTERAVLPFKLQAHHVAAAIATALSSEKDTDLHCAMRLAYQWLADEGAVAPL